MFFFKQIWQFPEHSLVAVGLFYAVEKIGGTALASSPWWGGIPLPIRVHAFCLLFRWIRDTWKKLKTVFSLSWTSVFESKQRKIINFFLVGTLFFQVLLVSSHEFRLSYIYIYYFIY